MSRFTHCPGEDCTNKVKVIEIVPEPEINFCCVPCWEFTWEHIQGFERGMVHEHSDQCSWRQLSRIHEPVVHGDFKIHTPKQAPPSHLGGKGGPQVS